MKYNITEKNGNKTFQKEAENELDLKSKVFDDFFEFEKIEEIKEENKIPLEFYWQRHPRYKGLKLGFSKLSFQDNSCFTCCLAFLIGKDPLEVHELLKKEKCYNGALIISDKTAKVLGLELKVKKIIDPNYFAKNEEFITIKEVLLGKSQHFVVRMTDGTIFDPWTGKFLPRKNYTFISFRPFKKVN